MNQEHIALFIVAIAAGVTVIHLFRKYLAEPIANALLKRGKVKLAMKVKARAKASGCDDCH